MNFRLIIIAAFAIMMTQCAQMLPLSGGETDKTPPVVIRQSPENKSTQFTGSQIKIEFDEYIQLKDIQNQLIITPRVQKEPEVSVSGKTLLLKFKEQLAPGTTYNVNFGSSVADIHEGNILPNLSVIFSTGSFIDSLTLSGNVIDAFTLKPASEASVFLYENGGDSSMFKRKPDYFAKADKSGNYKAEYLHAGKYLVAAIGDKNKNLIYDHAEEPVDMWYNQKDNLILIDSNQQKDFTVFRELPSRLFLKKTSYLEYGKVIYSFNKSFKDPLPGFAYDQKGNLTYSFNAAKDSLTVYFTSSIPDTVKFNISESGSAANGVESMLLVKPPQEKLEKDRRSGRLKPLVSSIYESSEEGTIHFKFNTRVEKADRSKIVFVIGKDSAKLDFTGNIAGEAGRIQNAEKIQGKGVFVFLPGALTSFLGETNDTFKIDFIRKTASDFGKIILEIEAKQTGKYVFQFLNERGASVYEIVSDLKEGEKKTEKTARLLPGNYSLRAFIDEDGDHKWTTGDLKSGRKPEKIFYNEKPVKLLADWKMTIIWTIQ